MTQRSAKPYRLNGVQRAANAVYTRLTLWGMGAKYRYLLTVTGRRSGQPRTTPVDVMTHDGAEWLVAPYGEVNWVRNLRAAGSGTLRRGHRRRAFRSVEVSAADAVPVIVQYIRQVPVTRRYWAVGIHATPDQLLQEAARHPVFRLTPA